MREGRHGFAGLVLLAVLGCGGGPMAESATAQAEPESEETAPVAEEAASAETAPVATLGWDMQQELEDVTYRETKGTEVQWELHADRVLQSPDAPAKLEVVTLRYFSGTAEPTQITADEADYDVEAQDAILRGNVRVVASNGDVLESEELVWNAKDRLISTEKEVRLRRGDSHIQGSGLETSPGLEDARLFNVSGIIHDAELRGVAGT